MAGYERLSALDASFLAIETGAAHMHVGSVGLFDLGPLRTGDGGVDFGRIRSYVEATLAMMPRYRQRLRKTPLFRRPVWVDDVHFNLDYHLRHTALPRPGTTRQLRRLAGRIFSQRLDRRRPLWECWVVEGVDRGRFAVIVKVHHCMVDGVAGADLLAVLLGGATEPQPAKPPPWQPRPAPGPLALVAAEAVHRTRRAGQFLGRRGRGGAGSRGRRKLGRQIATAIASIGQSMRAGLVPAPSAGINPRRIGPYRRFDWLEIELAEIDAVRRRLGGTVNDVALAVVTGALRRYLLWRGQDPGRIGRLRALVPVDVRRRDRHGAMGNRVALILAELPIGEPDAQSRYRRVRGITARLKRSRQAAGAEILEEVSDAAGPALLAAVLRAAAPLRAFNVVITNIRGPRAPLYLLGARMREVYPLVPLFERQALGIAVLSYAGGLFWGFNSDWERFDGLHRLTVEVAAAFRELAAVAGVDATRAAPGVAPR